MRSNAAITTRDGCIFFRLRIAFARISRDFLSEAGFGARQMVWALRILVGLAGAAGIAAAIAFWLHPDTTAHGVGLAIANATGSATVRADMAGFFGASGVFALLAASRNDGRYAFVVLVLMVFALGGRLINIAPSGYTPALLPPMIVEIVVIALFAIAARTLARGA